MRRKCIAISLAFGVAVFPASATDSFGDWEQLPGEFADAVHTVLKHKIKVDGRVGTDGQVYFGYGDIVGIEHCLYHRTKSITCFAKEANDLRIRIKLNPYRICIDNISSEGTKFVGGFLIEDDRDIDITEC